MDNGVVVWHWHSTWGIAECQRDRVAEARARANFSSMRRDVINSISSGVKTTYFGISLWYMNISASKPHFNIRSEFSIFFSFKIIICFKQIISFEMVFFCRFLCAYPFLSLKINHLNSYLKIDGIFTFRTNIAISISIPFRSHFNS